MAGHILITAPLIRRYLAATGWYKDDFATERWVRDGSMVRGLDEGIYDLTPDFLVSILGGIARGERRPRQETIGSLALCGAADAFGVGETSSRLLRMAGVDPARWAFPVVNPGDPSGYNGSGRRLVRWDWRNDPDAPRGWTDPERRLVLCEPGLLHQEATPHVADLAAQVAAERGALFIVPGPTWESSDRLDRALIPALLVRTNEDLAGQFPVGSETRVLMVSPSEEILLDPAEFGCSGCDGMGGGENLPFPGNVDNECGVCDGRGLLIDWICVLGGDAPMRPEWVRSIGKQADELDIPWTFAGWGEWIPREYLSDEELTSLVIERGSLPGIEIINNGVTENAWSRVGAHRSGAILDGKHVDKRPKELQ